MSYKYIVDGTPALVDTGRIKKALITINAALTGSIKVIDTSDGTATIANVATITNPTVGSKFEYNTLNNGFLVIASTTCDITAQTIPS